MQPILIKIREQVIHDPGNEILSQTDLYCSKKSKIERIVFQFGQGGGLGQVSLTNRRSG